MKQSKVPYGFAFTETSVPNRREKIFQYIKENPGINRNGILNGTGVSKSTIDTALKAFLDKGLITYAMKEIELQAHDHKVKKPVRCYSVVDKEASINAAM